METILTYLKWRGELTFEERPFCEVDNLVPAELAYLDLAGIVPEDGSGASISLQEASAGFYSQNRGNKCGEGPSQDFLAVMTASKRFHAVCFVLGMVPIISSGLVLWEYVFSASSFVLLYGIGKLVHAMYENGRQNLQVKQNG